MTKTIILKELKSIVSSPKFASTFAVCTLLMLLSIYIGVKEYQTAMKQYAVAEELVDQNMREARSWSQASNRIYRVPNPMQIFVAGVNNDIGRTSIINPTDPVKLTNSAYSDEPVYAVFRFIDFAFIVQVIFSLFAILFTYDSINGERENGTLQLTFANSLPRVHFLVGKFAGVWLGLVVPLLVPILLSMLLVVAFGVPLSPAQWQSATLLVGISLLFVTFFIAFGMFISSISRRSSTAFLFSLVAWIIITFIIPRAGVMAAGTLRPVASVAEVEGQRDAYAKQAWSAYRQQLEDRLRQREAVLKGKTEEEREADNDAHQWDWMEQEDKARKDVMKQIDIYGTKLEEDARNARSEQVRLALVLSRFSPASAYQLASMNLAGSNIDLKSRFEDALNPYRTLFNAFREKMEKESGNTGGIRISVDSRTGFKFQMGRESSSIDVSGVPRFAAATFSFSEAARAALPDTGLLFFFTIITIAGTFVAFLRYDIR